MNQQEQIEALAEQNRMLKEALVDTFYPMRRKTSAKRFGCAATFR